MQNILRLPLCQGAFSKSKNHKKANNPVNHGRIELISYELSEENIESLEEISIVKAKEALIKNLLTPREANEIFKQRSAQALPANIAETLKFHEAKTESLELSDSAKETFTRIGIRAREAFIEEQIERANFYNISYELYGDNYYQLMQDIARYEYLLEKAKDYCVDWDTSEYEPLALEQELEEAEHNAYMADQELRAYFSLTRGVEV